MGMQSFGQDNDDVKGSKFINFKLKEGETVRVGFVYWNEPSTMFKGTEGHYHEDSKKSFACLSDKKAGKLAICCTHNYDDNVSKWRIGAVLVKYIIEDDKLKRYELCPWLFSSTMFDKLKKNKKDFPLTEHDVTLSLSPNTKELYQVLDISPCKESLWQSKPELKARIQEEAKVKMLEVEHALPRQYTPAEVMEILGMDAPGTADANANIDLGDVLGNS